MNFENRALWALDPSASLQGIIKSFFIPFSCFASSMCYLGDSSAHQDFLESAAIDKARRYES